MARLDRLAPAKEVAQVGAVIGREFGHRLMAEVLSDMPAAKLDAALADLVHSELVFRRGTPPDATYSFKHALVRDTAYNSMLKSQRVLRHRQIAVALEQADRDTRSGTARVARLPPPGRRQRGGGAALLAGGGRPGDGTLGRARGGDALPSGARAAAGQPAGHKPCAEVELGLQFKLGNLLMQIEGFGSAATVACHTRARELASRLDQNDKCVLACGGIAASLWAAGRFEDVLGMLGQLACDDPASLRPMSRVLLALLRGLAKFNLGALDEARAATDDALRELTSIPPAARQDVNGVDPMVLVLAQSVAVSVHEGKLEQADAETLEALQIAQARDHVPTRAWALSLARWMAYREGDMEESIRLSQQVLDLSERMGFKSRLGSGRLLMGRAIVASGRVDEGARLLHEGFGMWSSAGLRAGTTEFTSTAADVLIEAGRMADAEIFVRAGEQFQSEVPERHFAAELARLRARLWQSAGDSCSGRIRLPAGDRDRCRPGCEALRAARSHRPGPAAAGTRPVGRGRGGAASGTRCAARRARADRWAACPGYAAAAERGRGVLRRQPRKWRLKKASVRCHASLAAASL